MKKRILICFLCLFLPGGTVFAAAGEADDPLISRSYVTDAFLPQVRAALANTAAMTAGSYPPAGGGTAGAELFFLSAGQSLELGAGQQFTLLSGNVLASVAAGEMVNVTIGAAASGGSADRYCRYIVCEDSRVYLDAAEDSLLKASAGAVQTQGSVFADVPRGAWFHDDVAAAYRRGLVDGMTDTTFEPGFTLTGAQCVKLAACMHQLWNEGTVRLENAESGLWYRSYVSYALANGILTETPEDYDSPVTRAQFVQIFYRALPESAYGQINGVPDGAIPDLAITDAGAAEVYRFYRAGILEGYAETGRYPEHAFGAASDISRAEVATIMNRMFDETARIRFDLT